MRSVTRVQAPWPRAHIEVHRAKKRRGGGVGRGHPEERQESAHGAAAGLARGADARLPRQHPPSAPTRRLRRCGRTVHSAARDGGVVERSRRWTSRSPSTPARSTRTCYARLGGCRVTGEPTGHQR